MSQQHLFIYINTTKEEEIFWHLEFNQQLEGIAQIKFSYLHNTNNRQYLHLRRDSLQIDQGCWITWVRLARFEDPLDVSSDEWEEMEKESGEQQRHQSAANNSCEIILQSNRVAIE